MSENRYVERTDSETGVATGLVLAIIAVLLVGVIALFMFFGGPGRFVGGTTSTPPSNTNINVPPQSQPAPQGGPQINVPPQSDRNVNPGQMPNSSGSGPNSTMPNNSGTNNSGSNSGSSQQAPSAPGSGSSSNSGSGAGGSR